MEYGWVWVLIPIAAILSRILRDSMRYRTQQRQLGASTRELEKDVAQLTQAKEELVERIQNLEAIVVSQTWGVLHDKGLAPAEQELKLAAVARRELGAPDGTAANQQRAEQLASRLR